MDKNNPVLDLVLVRFSKAKAFAALSDRQQQRKGVLQGMVITFLPAQTNYLPFLPSFGVIQPLRNISSNFQRVGLSLFEKACPLRVFVTYLQL